jgi:radical SAM protein with 4Fe4S-binding SPASM domain
MTNMPGSWEALNLATAMAKRAGLFTGWHFLICRPNLAELEAVVNLALGHGVDMVSILRLVNQGRAALNAKELEVSPREFSVLLRRFSTIKAKVGSRISMRAGCPVDFFFLWTPGAAPRVCKAGVDRCLVEPNGEVIPCAAFKGLPEFACGNVRDPGGLIGIWNRSNALTRFRAVREGFATSVCNCPRSSECQGRCAAQRFYSYGDLMQGPDPLCPRGVALPDALRSTAA